MAFEPVDFIARLVALVPKPRVNLTRYYGVLAPNHQWRALITPARRGKGGNVRVIACIEEQAVIDRILAHLQHKEQERLTPPVPGTTTPALFQDRERTPIPLTPPGRN